MNRHRDAQKRVACLQLFAHKAERDVIEAGAAVLFRNTNAEQAELGHLVENGAFKMRFFVPFFDIRRDLARTEFANGFL